MAQRGHAGRQQPVARTRARGGGGGGGAARLDVVGTGQRQRQLNLGRLRRLGTRLSQPRLSQRLGYGDAKEED